MLKICIEITFRFDNNSLCTCSRIHSFLSLLRMPSPKGTATSPQETLTAYRLESFFEPEVYRLPRSLSNDQTKTENGIFLHSATGFKMKKKKTLN